MNKEQAIKLGHELEVIAEELLNKSDDDEGDYEMKLEKTIVITTATNKGGEGKSSITQNLGYALSQMGYKVLLVDTDGQMNLSQAYGIRDGGDKNFYDAFENKDSLMNHVTETEYGVDLIVGHPKMKKIEGLMASISLSEKRFKAIVNPVREANVYDFVIVDTSPNLSKFNESILNASDKVLIPLEAAIFGVEGIGNIVEYVNEASEEYPVEILGVVMNKVDARIGLTKDVRGLIENAFGDKKLNSEIRQDTNIKYAQVEGMPLAEYDKSSRAVEDFKMLAKEVIQNVIKK